MPQNGLERKRNIINKNAVKALNIVVVFFLDLFLILYLQFFLTDILLLWLGERIYKSCINMFV